MSAIPYESREEEWEGYDDEEQTSLPGRPRRKWFTRASAALAAVLLGVVGFYVGVRVEKGQLSNSSTASGASGLAALASRLGSGAATSAGRTAGAAGAAGGAGRFAGGGGFPGAIGGAGGNATFGSVSSVSGNTIYVTDSAGNTVKVNLVGATKVSKNVGVSESKIRPGDTVVVQGLKQSGGTITAASVSDSGARTTGSAAGGTGSAGAGGGNSGSAAVNSLFGGGG